MIDVPTLPAYEALVNESTYWLAWCDHCQTWHRHGPMNGHREAHCTDESSPYWKSGYNIEYAGLGLMLDDFPHAADAPELVR